MDMSENTVESDVELKAAPQSADRIRKVVLRPRPTAAAKLNGNQSRVYESASDSSESDSDDETTIRKQMSKAMESPPASMEGSLVHIPTEGESLGPPEQDEIAVPVSEHSSAEGHDHGEPIPVENFANETGKEGSSIDIESSQAEKSHAEGDLPQAPAVSESKEEEADSNQPQAVVDPEPVKEEEKPGSAVDKVSMSVDSENGDHEYVKVNADEGSEESSNEKESELVPSLTPPEPAEEEPVPPIGPEPTPEASQPTVAKVVEEKKVSPAGGKCCSGLIEHPAFVPSVLIGGVATAVLIYFLVRKH